MRSKKTNLRLFLRSNAFVLTPCLVRLRFLKNAGERVRASKDVVFLWTVIYAILVPMFYMTKPSQPGFPLSMSMFLHPTSSFDLFISNLACQYIQVVCLLVSLNSRLDQASYCTKQAGSCICG